MAELKATDNSFENARRQSAFVDVIKRLLHNPTGMIGLSIFLLICLAGIFAPYLTPYSFNDIDVMNAFSPPSAAHILGTDELGRDLLTRLLYGARYSIGLGIAAQTIRLVIGIALGSVAGYFGGWVDNVIMRFCDIWQSIPGQLMTVVLATVMGNGWFNTVIAMGIGGIPGNARMIRGQLLSIREQEYVEAAISINCSGPRKLMKYMLPNAIQPMIVNTMMGIGGTITGAAGLSYLGLGVQPPTPEWGAMLTAGRAYIRNHPFMIGYPGLFLAVTVLALNMFGDGLRDAMDPHTKK